MNRRTILIASIAFALFPVAATAQTIPAGTTGTAFSANVAGTAYILNLGDTHNFTGASEAVTFGGATGPFNLTIDGSLISTSATPNTRGVRGTTSGVTYNVNVGASGLIQAFGDDAVQGRGIFNVTNNGTIYSGPNISNIPTVASATGQALDLANATGGIVINNGLIRTDGHDAVRLGSNMTMTNFGTVRTDGVVNDNSANNVFNAFPNNSTATTFSANDGVSFENGSNSSLTNYGFITGSRHGTETDVSATNITLTNVAGGLIIGRNGSGFGSDATSASVSNITVHNYGFIQGDFAGIGNIIDRTGAASFTQDGDGDGVDIDGAGTVNNYFGGQILGTGANGFDSGGRANTADGIAIGGGIINNSGVILGFGVGIVVNNDTSLSRSGVAATTITNNAGGTIEGLNGYAIRLENKLGDARDNDTIINHGTIIGGGTIPNPSGIVLRQNGLADPNSTGTLNGVTYTGTGSARFIRGDGSAIQTGEGNDVLTNTGTITGNTGRAINMEGGNDTLNIQGGAASITGDIDGGVGTNTLTLDLGVGNTFAYAGSISNFSMVEIKSGQTTLSGVSTYTGTTRLNGGDLILDGANRLAAASTLDLSGGSLKVIGGGANGQTFASLIFGDSSIIDLDPTSLTFLDLGSVALGETLSVLNYDAGTSPSYAFRFFGDLTGDADFLTLVGETTINGLAATYHFDGAYTDVTPVPEPATISFGIALMGVAFARRRRTAARR